MSDIATTIGGRWFGAITSTGEVGIVTTDGWEVPLFPERLTLKKILLGTDDGEDG